LVNTKSVSPPSSSLKRSPVRHDRSGDTPCSTGRRRKGVGGLDKTALVALLEGLSSSPSTNAPPPSPYTPRQSNTMKTHQERNDLKALKDGLKMLEIVSPEGGPASSSITGKTYQRTSKRDHNCQSTNTTRRRRGSKNSLSPSTTRSKSREPRQSDNIIEDNAAEAIGSKPSLRRTRGLQRMNGRRNLMDASQRNDYTVELESFEHKRSDTHQRCESCGHCSSQTTSAATHAGRNVSDNTPSAISQHSPRKLSRRRQLTGSRSPSITVRRNSKSQCKSEELFLGPSQQPSITRRRNSTDCPESVVTSLDREIDLETLKWW
jgi:hypothetical protein